MSVRETEQRCHELLLRLAGRLSDEHLWRYRDWLAGGAVDVVARSLPGTVVRAGIGLDDADHRRLADLLLPLGADPAMVNAILPGPEQSAEQFVFSAEGPVDGKGDSEVLVLGATLRGRAGIREVRCSWRRSTAARLKRVLLVTAAADHIELTGEIQRVLRALGEGEPCVEVLPADVETTAYHRAALQESVLVCEGAAELVGTRVP